MNWQRMKKEKRLRRSREKYKTIFERKKKHLEEREKCVFFYSVSQNQNSYLFFFDQMRKREKIDMFMN